MHDQPTYDSGSQHPVPDWFHNAKPGSFIHRGLYVRTLKITPQPQVNSKV